MNAYARSTMDPTQDAPPPSDATGLAPSSEAALAAEVEAEAERAERQRAADAVGGAVRQGLLRWTILVGAGSFAALVLRRFDVALFLVAAALFALAQSWDVRDRARTGDPIADTALAPGSVGRVLRALVPLLVPFAGALAYGGLALFARALPWSPAHIAAMQWCTAATVVCAFIAFPPIAHQLARAFMRGGHPGHTERLTAAIALVLLLLPVPCALLGEDLMGTFKSSGRLRADVGTLVGQLLGEVVFGLAAVGLWVTRDFRAVRDRLGLGAMGVRHVSYAVAGLVLVSGLNAGMEWLERTYYHALWLRDQDTVKLIAANMNVGAALLLGVSAGVGEEIMVRGALQPRVGLYWASLLFASAHLQYTWFGMLTIVLFGMALGVVRNRANTTTAIVVHVLYDILAALGAR